MSSTQLLERSSVARPTDFAIAELAPAANLPAVTGQAIEKTLRATDQLVAATAPKAPGRLVEFLAFVVGPTVPVLVAFAGVAAFTPGSPDLLGPTLLASAIAATAGFMGLARRQNRRADRLLQTQLGRDLERLLQHETPRAMGLQRAWVARRARVLLDHIVRPDAGREPDLFSRVMTRAFLPLQRRQFMMRVAELTKFAGGCSPEERAEAAKVEAIYRRVFPLPYDGYADRSCEPGVACRQDLEQVLAEIEALTPEARELLRPCILETVVAVLDRDPADRWRRQRFVEALDGKRTPYSDKTLDVAMPALDLETVRKGAAVNRETYSDVVQAVHDLSNELRRGKRLTHARLDSAEGAEQLAAHFERLQFRAAIYGKGKSYLVTVYDPAQPPSGYDVTYSRIDSRRYG